MLPPQRELSAVRLTEDESFCGVYVITAGEYIFPHSLPRMVRLLLRKEARGGGEATTS